MTTTNLALIRKENRTQRPMYYTNQAFHRAKGRYTKLEKKKWLYIASRKLRPYFQARTIVVMIDQPIKKAMNKLDAIGRLIQWVVELS